MKSRKFLALGLATVFAVGACTSTSATPSPASQAPAPTTAPASTAPESAAPSESAAAASPSAEALAPDPAEAVIQGVEPNAEIGFWTFYLSPTFDTWIKDTITRFEATYPGVKVNWEDHQATFKDELNNAFAAGNAPDVINLSVGAGWVSEYADKGLLLPLDDKVPQAVKDSYFEGLWKEQLIDGVNYQFPWYQGLSVELINKAIMDKAGVAVEDFPKTIDGLPALCKTILDKTGTLCDIRLTVDDLLAQMVYEGNVKVLSDDGKKFTFDSPEAVAWLQMYVDMVKAGTVDKTVLTAADDRVGLNAFAAGNAAVLRRPARTWPASSRTRTPRCTTTWPMVPAPIGKSSVTGKGLMSISVKNDTKFPNASMALAQFFTNARSMTDFSKQVAIYPSTSASYDDPFFSETPSAVEDSARPLAKDIVSTYADIVPTIPNKADVNAIVLDAVESALFNDVDTQQALSDAVKKANATLK